MHACHSEPSLARVMHRIMPCPVVSRRVRPHIHHLDFADDDSYSYSCSLCVLRVVSWISITLPNLNHPHPQSFQCSCCYVIVIIFYFLFYIFVLAFFWSFFQSIRRAPHSASLAHSAVFWFWFQSARCCVETSTQPALVGVLWFIQR